MFDEKGHKTNLSTHTIKIPGLELVANTQQQTGNIITNLTYNYDGEVNHKGTFTASRMNLGAIPLGSYVAPTGGNGIDTSSTLADALSTLDARIYVEEQARATALTNAISALDLGTVTNNTTDKTTTFVSSINEVDGIVTYTTQGITAASTSSPGIVQLNDTINSTDTDKAATANAVKTAYDLAATKVTAHTPFAQAVTARQLVTYDIQGLVTGGSALVWDDIKDFVVGEDANTAPVTLNDLVQYLVGQNGTALAKTLTSITVTPPETTTYEDGQTLSLTGMVITGNYTKAGVQIHETITSDYTVSPTGGSVLSAADSPITVTVTYQGKSDTFTVTVNPATDPENPDAGE